VVCSFRSIIEIHGDGSTVHEIFRTRAGASFLKKSAINVRASIIEVG